MAFQNAENADLCIAMGSSLRVTPAADIPATTARMGGSLVICNLQKTPLDHLAALCIYGKCDDIMEKLMKKLDYQIPKWQMKKRVQVELKQNNKIDVMGVDSNGAPFMLFPKITVHTPVAQSFPSTKQTAQPFTANIDDKGSLPETFDITCRFQRNYAEPDLRFTVESADLEAYGSVVYEMVYGAGDSGNWEIIVKKVNRDVIGIVENFTQGERPD